MRTTEAQTHALENVERLMGALAQAKPPFKGSPAFALLILLHARYGAEGLVPFIDRLERDEFTFTPEERLVLPIVHKMSEVVAPFSRRSMIKGAFAAGFAGGSIVTMLQDTFSDARTDAPPAPASETLLTPQATRRLGYGVVGGTATAAAMHATFLYRDHKAPDILQAFEPLMKKLNVHIAQELDPSQHRLRR